jgi:hypothetical protein
MKKVVYAALLTGVLIIPSSAFAQTAIVTVPSEVDAYVVKEKTPSVTVEREVIIGSELPNTVTLHRVPKYDDFSYAVVNKRRVIVDAKTRRVVKIIEE